MPYHRPDPALRSLSSGFPPNIRLLGELYRDVRPAVPFWQRILVDDASRDSNSVLMSSYCSRV